MKFRFECPIIIVLVLSFSCQSYQRIKPEPEIFSIKGLNGSKEGLNTPFVAAGDKLYVIGHQDGSFPDIGWHILGEMGGVWSHPIKLMDGFSVKIFKGNQLINPDSIQFTNYPIGSRQSFYYMEDSLVLSQYIFVPDGIPAAICIIELSSQKTNTSEYVLELSAQIDLLPTWLSEKKGLKDYSDSSWVIDGQIILSKDLGNPWFVSQQLLAEDELTQIRNASNISISNELKHSSIKRTFILSKTKKQIFTYHIAGSEYSAKNAIENLRKTESYKTLITQKTSRFNHFSSMSLLKTQNSKLDEMWLWGKFNQDWLIRDVSGIGRGLSAGLPDYPWWFGADNMYSLRALMLSGRFDEVENTIDLLHKISMKENGNGRIIHETSTNGETYNLGNLNETPQFITLIWNTYRWNGDTDFLKRYYPDLLKSIEWITSQDKDNNGYPDGPGMMEIPGLHTEMIDVVAYLAEAYKSLSQMAQIVGDSTNAMYFLTRYDFLVRKINTEWWVEKELSFADFRATKTEAVNLIKEAAIRADTLKLIGSKKKIDEILSYYKNFKNDVDSYSLHHNWVINTPMEVGIADSIHAINALITAQKYTSKYGVFVTGIDRNPEEENENNKWKNFSYVGAVMTLPTGVQAIAEARYGRINESYDYIKKLINSYGYLLPGSSYEVSPDYGMFTQAWNTYGSTVSIIEYYFGVSPKPESKLIIIKPNFPSDLCPCSLKNLKIAEGLLSIEYLQNRLTIEYSDSTWNLELHTTNLPTIIDLEGNQIKFNKPTTFTFL